MSLLTIYLAIIHKQKLEIEFGLTKLHFFLITAFSLFVSSLCIFFLLTFNTYDHIYQETAALVKHNIYPPQYPSCPEARSSYHYGVILYSSALQIFSNLDPWYSFIPIQGIFIFATPLSIFLLIYYNTRNFLQSFLAAIMGCLCANLTSLELLSLINPKALLTLISYPYHAFSYMNESGFAATTIKAFISPNISAAIPLCIIFFYICTNKTILRIIDLIKIFLISAFLYFTCESFWFPEVVSILAYHLYLLAKTKLNVNNIKTLSYLAIIFLIIPFLIGGVLAKSNDNVANYLYFNPKSYIYSWIGILSYFYDNNWLINNQIVCQGDGSLFYKVPFFSKYFFIEMGLPLILLPLIFIYLLIKRESKVFLFFMLSGTISLIVPFLVNYLPKEIETNRFFTYARLVYSILLGLFFGKLYQVQFTRFTTKIFRSAISILIIISIIPCIAWLLPTITIQNDYRNIKIPTIDKKSLRWLLKNAKSGDRGIGPTNIPHENFDLITASGVYGASLSTRLILEKETRKTALITLNPCLLKELKVKWIYLNNELLKEIPSELINKLQKEKVLILRYKTKQKDEIRKIYEFIPKDNNIFCQKNYAWIIGRMYHGRFLPLINTDTNQNLAFENYKTAINTLNKIKVHLNSKEAYWYRVEAIRI